MGMGYAGAFAVVLEEEDLLRIIPKELEAFNKAKADFDAFENSPGFAAFATAKDHNDNVQDVPESQPELVKLDKAFTKLLAAFKKQTGIKLWLGYHDQEEEGDRYDDISGAYWSLDFADSFPPSKALKTLKKKCKKYVGIQHFVTFG